MAMQWRDSEWRYGVISRALHWAMAALFLWQFLGMIAREIVGRTPLTGVMVGSHAPVGTLLLTLLVVRVLWGLANQHRRPAYEPGLLGLAARLGHLALYALMLIVPTLALLRLYGSGRGFAPFGIPLFESRPDKIEWMMAPANLLHGNLAWVLLVLILGHVGMVLVHRFILRDSVTSRMIGRSAGPAHGRV